MQTFVAWRRNLSARGENQRNVATGENAKSYEKSNVAKQMETRDDVISLLFFSKKVS